MSVHINTKTKTEEYIMDLVDHTLISKNGKPQYVVVPYADYLVLIKSKTPRIPIDGSTPHEVLKLEVENNWSGIRAWREYLGFTQTEMARCLSISQSAYSKMESPNANLRKTTKMRIAKALGITLEQL